MTNPNQQQALAKLALGLANIPFNKMIGLELQSVTPDEVEMTFSMRNELVGNFIQEILHGGVISSVLDMAGGVAAMAKSVERHGDTSQEELIKIFGKSSTIDLHVNFISPGRGKHFKAIAYVTKAGAKITFTRMELLNSDEKLIATASGTYLVG